APPGVKLEHFWRYLAPAHLQSSPEALLVDGGARSTWNRLGETFGTSIFFPVLPSGQVLLGEGWDASLAAAAPPDTDGQWMPWKIPAQARFRLDAFYEIGGERVALILASWSRQGDWSDEKDPRAPIFHAKETGEASYLWLLERGWPLLGEVFGQTEIEVV